MIAWSAPSSSRPAPSARCYAALGLDRSAFLSLPMVEAESPPVSGADPPLPYSSTRPIGRACIPGSISPVIPGSPAPIAAPTANKAVLGVALRRPLTTAWICFRAVVRSV